MPWPAGLLEGSAGLDLIGRAGCTASVQADDWELAAMFYILTPMAMMAYYRRRLLTSAWNFLMIGVLPMIAIASLGWVI